MKVNINAKKIETVVNVEGDATIHGRDVAAVPKPAAPGAVPPAAEAVPVPEEVVEPAERNGVFVSYAHEDAEWIKHFRTVLAPLIRSATVPIWFDGDIEPGDTWRAKIYQAMASSKVAVLFLSPHFLASSFIMDVELPFLVAAAQEGKLTLTWMMVRKCITKGTPLGELQALHETSRPLNALSEAELDRTLVQICEKLQQLVTN